MKIDDVIAGDVIGKGGLLTAREVWDLACKETARRCVEILGTGSREPAETVEVIANKIRREFEL